MITFVSAYYTLESTPYFNSHPEEWDPAPIFELARSGIQLCLYIGSNCAFETAFEELEKECPNFRIMPYRLYYKDMWIYRALDSHTKQMRGVSAENHSTSGIAQSASASTKENVVLPKNRNMEKDTLEYMVYMHSRHEIIEDAISENPWDSTHFAWIDFNASRLFSKKQESFGRLHEIAAFPFPQDSMYFAGCWGKLDEPAANNIAMSIHWRFCGAFFLGDTQSFGNFADLYRTHFPVFLKETGVFCWEVNFWAWLEYRVNEWRPTWYRGDHNDNMLNVLTGVSADNYATSLGEDGVVTKKVYEYPAISPFLPGSASYLEHGGKHYLNTRFVNYWMYPNGYYRFHNQDMVIENRNYLSELREDPESGLLTPVDYREMNEMVLYGVDGMPLVAPKREKRTFSVGLEDIRLFNGPGGRVRFIATNVEYSPGSKNRMVLGTYDMETASYRDCQVVVPPDVNSWCEKNWIPVPFVDADGVEEERFIYKWSPMEIGRVDAATGQLQIVMRHTVRPWIFERLRGSTTFVDCPRRVLPEALRGTNTEYLVGLAHFSEEHSPRHYYHLLILLEKGTLRPVRYSRVFYFESLSIEFCIGMCIREETKYVFWISRFDRDPIMVEISVDALKFDSLV
jgi:hypothetical protein